MIWRSLTAADLPAAERLSRLAGWNQTEADWSGYLQFEPEGCWAVEIGGEVAGTATALGYGPALGWIGMVLVHPDHRRRGLGTELLRRAIVFHEARGVRCVGLDATAAGRKVYLPLGFRDDGEVIRWEGTVPAPSGLAPGPELETRIPEVPAADAAPGRRRFIAGSIPPPGTTAIAPFASAPLAELAALDAAAFGVPRPRVLQSLGGRDPRWCFSAAAEGKAAGYLIAREGREAIQLGPWIAQSPAAAEALLAAFFRSVPGRRVFVDIPAANRAGGEFLRRFGFGIQRTFTRMFRGEPAPPGRPAFVYGTSGAEKG